MAKFQPGKSGNPSGRPKVDLNVRDIARQNTVQAMKVLADALRNSDPKVAIKAAELLLDRAWGKPVAFVEQTIRREVHELTDAELYAIASGGRDDPAEESPSGADPVH